MGVVRYLAVGGLVAASLTTIAASPPVAAAPGDVALDTAFADDGVLTAPEVLDEYGGFTTDDSGRVIVAGTVADGPGEQLGHIAVARLRPDGSPDPEFGDDGVVITSVVTVMGRFAVASVDVLDDGSVIAAGIRQFDPEEVFSRALWTVKLDTAGTPVPGYGADGVAIEEQPYTAGDPIGGFASDGSAVFSQSGFGTTFLTRVNAAGQFFDLMPGETGVPSCTAPNLVRGAVPVSPTDYVFVYDNPIFDGTECNETGNGSLVVARQNHEGGNLWVEVIADGTRLSSDFSQQVLTVMGDSVFIGAHGPDDGPRVIRLDADSGDPVVGWGTGGTAELPSGYRQAGTMAGLPDGRFAVVNVANWEPSAAYLDIVSPSGAPDPAVARITAIPSSAPQPLVHSAVASTADRIFVFGQTDTGAEIRAFAIEPDVGPDPEPDIVSVAPGRLLDTRPAPDGETVDGEYLGNGPVGPTGMIKVQIAGRGGVLTDASAAVLNVTAVLPDAPGYLTVYPCTPEPPNASNVNYDAGSIVANGVTAKLDANGDVCIYTHARTHILVDVLGFLPGDTAVTPTVPARFLDTRTDSTAATFDGNDLGNGPVGPTDVIKVKIADRGDVTAGASAAILNVTAVAPDGAGYLTVYPCTPEPPNASNVNYSAGSVVANGVTAKLDANGDVCIYTHARTHILVDVAGFLPDATDVTPTSPARYLDTRTDTTADTFDDDYLGNGPVGPTNMIKVEIADRGEVPDGASAAILNVTAVAPDGAGYLTVYPCTPEPPNASNVNYAGGDVVANNVTAKLDANGDVCVYTHARTHILVDVTGFVG